MLALLAIIVLFVAVLLFAPFIIIGRVSDNAYSVELRFLGFWFLKEKDGARKGFLFKKFPKKPEKEETEKGKPSGKKGKEPEDVVEEAEESEREKKPPLSFWLKRRQLFFRIVVLVLRFLYEVVTSFRVGSYRLYMKIGDGAPEITGTIYGWLYAIKANWPDLNFDFEYDFYPDAPWLFTGRIVVKNSLFRLLIWPLINFVWRLPKMELYSAYREYKKLIKVE